MKRRDLLRHLQANECYFVREGGNHSIYQNIINGRRAGIPRHNEIKDPTVKAICKQLDIPVLTKK
jgi:mRNA interferase HicA